MTVATTDVTVDDVVVHLVGDELLIVPTHSWSISSITVHIGSIASTDSVNNVKV